MCLDAYVFCVFSCPIEGHVELKLLKKAKYKMELHPLVFELSGIVCL